MIPIVVGASAFALLIVADVADWKKLPALRFAGLSLAYLLVLSAIVALVFSPEGFQIPLFVRIVAVVFSLAFLLLLLRSLVFDLRGAQGPGNARSLVRTGTYGLSRHPGVLWFFLLHSSLVVASGSRTLLIALPIWTALNLALVFIEDRILFPRIFGAAYVEYSEEIPFLIPSRESLRRYVRDRFEHRRGRPPAGPSGKRSG